MAPKWIPKWLHFKYVFALVFDPFFEPPPNLLFAQTDPPRGAQGTEKAKNKPQNGAKMGPKNSGAAPLLHSWSRLVPAWRPRVVLVRGVRWLARMEFLVPVWLARMLYLVPAWLARIQYLVSVWLARV